MTRKKVIILVATVCIVLGAALAGVGFVRGAGSGGQWSEGASRLQTREIALTQPFSAIEVRVSSDEVRVRAAADGNARVVCAELPDAPHSVEVAGGVLYVESAERSAAWYESISLGFATAQPSVTIYLPEGAYRTFACDSASGDVSLPAGFTFGEVAVSTASGRIVFDAAATDTLELKTSSGDIEADGAACPTMTAKTISGAIALRAVQAQTLSCSSSSGDILLAETALDGALDVETTSGALAFTDVNAGSASIHTVSGDVEASGLRASGEVRVQTTSGAITLDRCDGGTIHLESISGAVTGSLASEKEFRVATTSGTVDVPYGRAGAGVCRIETTSGDVRLTIEEAE